MNSRQVEAFLDAAKTLSFTQTADNMLTTAQNVSLLISGLESELGFRLFDRRTHPLNLSREGRSFNEFFANQGSRYKRMVQEIELDRKRREHHFNIGISVWINPFGEIDRPLTEFRHQNPDVIFSGNQHHNETLFDMMREGLLDAVIMPGSQLMDDRSFGYVNIAEEELCLCVPRDITSKKLDPNCWGLPMLTVATWNWGAIEQKYVINRDFEKMGITPRQQRILPNVQSLFAQLTTSRCAAIFDRRFSFAASINTLRWIPLTAPEPTYCCCVFHRDNENPLKETFVAFLADYFKEQGVKQDT